MVCQNKIAKQAVKTAFTLDYPLKLKLVWRMWYCLWFYTFIIVTDSLEFIRQELHVSFDVQNLLFWFDRGFGTLAVSLPIRTVTGKLWRVLWLVLWWLYDSTHVFVYIHIRGFQQYLRPSQLVTPCRVR